MSDRSRSAQWEQRSQRSHGESVNTALTALTGQTGRQLVQSVQLLRSPRACTDWRYGEQPLPARLAAAWRSTDRRARDVGERSRPAPRGSSDADHLPVRQVTATNMQVRVPMSTGCQHDRSEKLIGDQLEVLYATGLSVHGQHVEGGDDYDVLELLGGREVWIHATEAGLVDGSFRPVAAMSSYRGRDVNQLSLGALL